MARWLDGDVRSGRVALLHNHSLWMMANIYPGRVARRHGTPLVVSPRGTLSAWAMQSGSAVKALFWPLVQRPALAATACFHATALSEYEDIRRLGFRQPVAIIPNGIDIPDLPPVGTAKRERTLLFLGRIHPKKGLDLLLPAWRAVQRRFPNWCLRIVGPDNGGYLTTLRQMAQELALERVEFAGPLLGEQKWRAYQEADLFVLPTYSENFGMAVAEALAAGTPAIVSKGAPWAGLEEQKAGWWIDIGVDALVATLDEALALPQVELAAMGQSGRTWMHQDFSWDSIGRKMAATYEWVISGGETPEWIRED
jgi:glycosyltransferase involved in cell wall biosynthesis